jgi:hypothetical protein
MDAPDSQGVQYASVFVLGSAQALGAEVILHLPGRPFPTHVSIECADGQVLRYALTFADRLEPHEGTCLVPEFDWSRPDVNDAERWTRDVEDVQQRVDLVVKHWNVLTPEQRQQVETLVRG